MWILCPYIQTINGSSYWGWREVHLFRRKHGVYLQCVTVSNLPEGYEERLIEMFPVHFAIFTSLPWILTTSPYPKSTATFSATGTM